jgi:hypothetical protein
MTIKLKKHYDKMGSFHEYNLQFSGYKIYDKTTGFRVYIFELYWSCLLFKDVKSNYNWKLKE